MTRSTAETARWLIRSSLDIRTVKARMYEIESLDELRTWASEFNQVCEQLAPERRSALADALERHRDRLQE